jgi:IS30 family transposase
MPAERISMRQAREIIRLKFSSVSAHEIARRLGMARSSVRETLRRAESAGLSWPQAESMAEAELEGVLYANRRSRRGHRRVGPSVPMMLRQRPAGSLPLRAEVTASNGYAPFE